MLIDIDNVSVAFGKEKVLEDISFCVHEAEFIGLIGPNGAGKTTLLRVLLGLLKPDEGTVAIQKNAIGYIPQRGSARDQQVPINVKEVVSLQAQSGPDTLSALQAVRMTDYLDHRFDDLSGGQQQRVLIAKALAAHPRLLILDEPTTGIDESSQADFYHTLEDLQRSGITIIMVSHDIDTVLSQVDRVMCLNRTLLYDGSPDTFEVGQYVPGMYNDHHRRLHHQHGGLRA